MRFRHFDNLRGFCVVARHASFTRAAEALNLTKGAISHQIDALEAELGFRLFRRRRSHLDPRLRTGDALVEPQLRRDLRRAGGPPRA